jgi:hypothetical protein
MKIILMCVLLGMAGPVAADYGDAMAAMRLDEQQAKALDGYLTADEADLASNDPLDALLAANERAIELFIQASTAANSGYMFGPKPEKLSVSMPAIKYGDHIKLFRLLLIDARVKSESGFLAEAERDLLGAAGFMLQVSGQKTNAVLSTLVHTLCLQKAFPLISGSIRGNSASPAYLNAMSAVLARNYAAMDSMRAALTEEGEIMKVTIREAINPVTAERESAKVPFYRRFAVRKLQDEEFFNMVYARYDAAADARTQAFIRAFADNDPAPADAFVEKQIAELAAKGKDPKPLGFMDGLKIGLTGGGEAKARMADAIVYSMTAAGVPQYGKLVARYHVSYSMLGVLRTALAVKATQRRARNRLPAGLENLVPDYIAALPKDPFNKFAPFTYLKSGKRFAVYGYGPDGADGKAARQMDFKAFDENQANCAGDIVYAE